MGRKTVASVVVTVVACVGAAAGVSAPRLDAAAPSPFFGVAPSLLNQAAGSEGSAVAGQPFSFSFCAPAPSAGRLCGGPFAKHQLNPRGGTRGGPYTFAIQIGAGLLPPGLVLHSRTGLLSGTIDAKTAVKTWPFTVCTSATSFAPSTKTVGSTCHKTAVVVHAPDFSGLWNGTFTADEDATKSGCGHLPFTGAVKVGATLAPDGTYHVTEAFYGLLINGTDSPPECTIYPSTAVLTVSLLATVSDGTLTGECQGNCLGTYIRIASNRFSTQVTKAGSVTMSGTLAGIEGGAPLTVAYTATRG